MQIKTSPQDAGGEHAGLFEEDVHQLPQHVIGGDVDLLDHSWVVGASDEYVVQPLDPGDLAAVATSSTSAQLTFSVINRSNSIAGSGMINITTTRTTTPAARRSVYLPIFDIRLVMALGSSRRC